MTPERKREIVEELVADRLSKQGWTPSAAKHAGALRLSYKDWCAFELLFDGNGCRMLSWACFFLKDEYGFMERKFLKEPHTMRMRSGSVNDLANQIEKAADPLRYAAEQCGSVKYKWNVDREEMEE